MRACLWLLSSCLTGCLFFEHGGGTGGAGGGEGGGPSVATGSTTSTGGSEPACDPYAGIDGLCLLASLPDPPTEETLWAGDLAISRDAAYFTVRHAKIQGDEPDVECAALSVHRFAFTDAPGMEPALVTSVGQEEVVAGSHMHAILGVRRDDGQVLLGFQSTPDYRPIRPDGKLVSLVAHANAFAFSATDRVFVAIPAAPELVYSAPGSVIEESGGRVAKWVGVDGNDLNIGIYQNSTADQIGSVCRLPIKAAGNMQIDTEKCVTLPGLGDTFDMNDDFVYARVFETSSKIAIHRIDSTIPRIEDAHRVLARGPISASKNFLWYADIADNMGAFTSVLKRCDASKLAQCSSEGLSHPTIKRIAAIGVRPVSDLSPVYFLAETDAGIGLFRYVPMSPM